MIPGQDVLFKNQFSPGEAIRQDPVGTLTLYLVPGIGSAYFRALLKAFGCPEGVFKAGRRALESVPGIGPQTAEAIRAVQKDGTAEKLLEELNRVDAQIVSIWDDGYPGNLKEIHDPPVLLFVRGALPAPEEVRVSIVGTRTPNRYGIKQAQTIAEDLACQGIGIVSGMARGIDTAGHEGALKGNGRTYAVFGCGIDHIYPPENVAISEKIEAAGALISEFVPGTKPDPGFFPRRNRVISGLAAGVLIVQGSEKSGALITAKCALEQNREVFALPGSVSDRLSAGPNKLIKQGATLVASAQDILNEIGFQRRRGAVTAELESLPQLNPSEETVARKLSQEPVHIDHLVRELQRPVSSVLADLLSLEMKGWVVQLPGKLFALK